MRKRVPSELFSVIEPFGEELAAVEAAYGQYVHTPVDLSRLQRDLSSYGTSRRVLPLAVRCF